MALRIEAPRIYDAYNQDVICGKVRRYLKSRHRSRFGGSANYCFQVVPTGQNSFEIINTGARDWSTLAIRIATASISACGRMTFKPINGEVFKLIRHGKKH